MEFYQNTAKYGCSRSRSLFFLCFAPLLCYICERMGESHQAPMIGVEKVSMSESV